MDVKKYTCELCGIEENELFNCCERDGKMVCSRCAMSLTHDYDDSI